MGYSAALLPGRNGYADKISTANIDQLRLPHSDDLMPGYLSISGNIDISLVPSCSLYIHTKAGIQMKLVSLHSDLVRAKTLVSSPGLRRATENEVGKISITHFFIFFYFLPKNT